MHCLVTGGAGFIGSNLAKTLAAQKHDVTVLDNFSSGRNENLAGFDGRICRSDLRDAEFFDGIEKPDVIFHQAAITDTTEMDEALMMSVNFEGSVRVFEYAKAQNIPLVYASSAATYGDGPVPMREDQPMNPLNIYGKSKQAFDEYVAGQKNLRVPVFGLKYFNVYGPGESGKGKMASMIWQLSGQMKAGLRPKIFHDGEQCRDHVYVKDIVNLNLLAWKSGKSGICNAATGSMTSFNRVIAILNQRFGASLEPDYFPNPYSFYQDKTRADLSRAQSLLGYRPEYDIEAGIGDYLQS